MAETKLGVVRERQERTVRFDLLHLARVVGVELGDLVGRAAASCVVVVVVVVVEVFIAATLGRLVDTVAAAIVVSTLILIAIAGTTTLGRTIFALGQGLLVELHDALLALSSATLASTQVRDRVCSFAVGAKFRVGHGLGHVYG